MATVNKNFRVKDGLIVEGAKGTIDGSDILTAAAIENGAAENQNITVTYDSNTNKVVFVAENGVADSTTADLPEDPSATGTSGTQYFTDARAAAAALASATEGATNNSLVKRTWGGEVAAQKLVATEVQLTDPTSAENYGSSTISDFGSITAGTGGVKISAGAFNTDVTLESSNGGNILLNAEGDVYLSSVTAGNEVVTKSDIDALQTSDIEEDPSGPLYFTAQRAIDAVGGSATSENTPNTVVKRDSNGSFAAEDITANNVTLNNVIFEDNGGSIGTDVTGLNIFAPNGDINLAAQTGQVKIGGSQVTTAENEQTLTNKTIGDALAFNDGQNTSSITVTGDDLEVMAYNDLTLTSNTGNLVLRPDPLNEVGKAYIGSTTAGNEIATHSYVDNAVSGLSWKESVHLLQDSRNQTAPPLSGPTGVLVIDGHSALTQANDGYRILILTTNSENTGIYTYNDDGSDYTLTRSSDADAVAELVGAAVFVMEGTQFNATSWVQANHYLAAFEDQDWTQFSGTGNYTAGFGINLVGREFSADTDEMATSQALTTAVGDLTDYVDGFLNSNDGTVIEYIDDQDAATLTAANGYADTLVATGNATATPQYLAININDITKQVASQIVINPLSEAESPYAGIPGVPFYTFDKNVFSSAKFLVRLASGIHTEISEFLITLDTSGNIAVTEYAIVGTNGSLGTVYVQKDPNSDTIVLTVDASSSSNNTVVTASGTLFTADGTFTAVP